MPRQDGISFRILHPDPFDFFRLSPLSKDITCAVDFPSPPSARRLVEILRRLPAARHVQTRRSPIPQVTWSISWPRALSLPKAFRGFPELSRQIQLGLRAFKPADYWRIRERGNRSFQWARKTQVMGILNVTPNSFSDGGRFLEKESAVEQALRMQEAGADWIDIGGESTRPGARAVSAREEKERILPVIRACAKVLKIPVSVDTYKAEVASAAVGEGAQMVNDIGALSLDPRMGKALARLKVPVILMHMRGKPRTMQKKPVYKDILAEILAFFRCRMAYALQSGIAGDRILLDPGFGFGKTPWHNMEITRRLWEFKVLGRPLVLGPSRKSTLGVLLGGAPPERRVEATGAVVTAAILKGADFIRVHDVQSMVPMVKIADAIRYDRGLSKNQF